MDEHLNKAAIDNRLFEASHRGDIGVLYELIRTDAEVLRRIDEIMFVDTPLHIAASVGHSCFAMEIMNMMPSFARKLNKSGLSPMHLAMLNGNLELVLLFLEVDCDLVRVKGRGGLTPLHFAIKYGNIDLLAKFLVACPKSIEDVTANGETALHIARKTNTLEAFEVLVGWLERICHEDALKWNDNIRIRKDLQGKTALDIALVPNNEYEVNSPMLQLSSEITNISGGNRLTSVSFQNRQTFSFDQSLKPLTNYIKSKRSFDERFAVFITRNKMKISDNARSALLVVLGLLVAATFPAVFSPPGSVRQDPDNNNSNMPGTVVMDPLRFLFFSIYNTVTVHAAICLTGLLLPDGFLGSTLMILLFFLLSCYNISIQIISPSDRIVDAVNTFLSISMYLTAVFILLIHYIGKRKLRQLCCTSN